MSNSPAPLIDSQLLTVEGAARLLGLGRTSTYELIATGQLWAIHIGRTTRISRDELDRFIRSLDRPESAPSHA